MLRNTFTRRLPPHLVFREIFTREQRDDESCELFVCHFRALVAQLPYPLPERVQLDMLYGLLHRRIRKRLSSDGLESFTSMLKRVKEIKHLKRESASQTAATQPTTDKMANRKPRPQCHFCRDFRHLEADCQKTKAAIDSSRIGRPGPDIQKNSSWPQTSCFGCGAPGYIRSNCPNCAAVPEPEQAAAALNFSRVDILGNENAPCPMLPVKVLGLDGVGCVDTGSK
ncbi:hypothetical protein J437_LFUL009718 [Ladona fulva]|uniref:CCHC-type domain-containing protein n=1 Tax=Ladona fulva TaxID=123851 RepID=A0A8K0P2Y4_LADFU|nr:hypothetical protein J437_LFUL009718 [Ladona fulva]